MTTNPYLNVRCAFAQAKIATITDPDDDSFCVAMAEAEQLGYRDSADDPEGDLPVPLYFADEPNLAQSWQQGVRNHQDMLDMDNCSGCSNDRGDPCHIHG
ncbi:hypothetical protein SAMN05216466_106112 [Paraburkholderia phenazinium]|uniref:Uncharacterized protein n=1 Tax=Paraburkholderia phenazinium TaxID=60549 RepID=A0A1G7YBH4_9BURK|nr:hypothetical protein [Paraburkholderia phenazinium]SDG93639.1 hypothetical protein SAMN05216466_106112 [Paraburkholderia phenazinium]